MTTAGEPSKPDLAIFSPITILTFATGVRWIGWGMAVPLMPVFLYSLLGSYYRVALTLSLGRAISIITAPFVGIFIDRYTLKSIMLVGLTLFFFGGAWSLAAATSRTSIVVVGNALVGFAAASDVVGRITCIRRHTTYARIEKVIGVQNSVLNAALVVGACTTLAFVRHISLTWIFFGVIPTNLVALLIVARYLPKGAAVRTCAPSRTNPAPTMLWSRSRNFVALAGITFLVNALLGVYITMVPLFAYNSGVRIGGVVGIWMAGILPQVFSAPLAGVGDRYRGLLLTLGLSLVAGASILMAVLTATDFILVVAVLSQLALVSLVLHLDAMVTVESRDKSYGRLSGIFEALKELGRVLGTLAVGILLDHFGSNTAFLVLAVVALAALSTVFKLPFEHSNGKRLRRPKQLHSR